MVLHLCNGPVEDTDVTLSAAKDLLDAVVCQDGKNVWLLCDSIVTFELRWKMWLKGLSETESLNGRRFYFPFTGSYVNVLIDPKPKQLCGIRGELFVLDGFAYDEQTRKLAGYCVNDGGRYAEVN